MKYLTLVFSLCISAAAAQAQDSLKHSSAKNIQPPGQPSKQELAKMKAANIKKAAKTQFQYFIIRADSARYGYSIYADGNLYIQQTTIPALPGNRGFADTAAAGRTARFAIRKIKAGEIPPTISVADLKKLKII